MSLIDLLESLPILFFPPEELNHLNPCEILLEKTVHLGDLESDLAKCIPGPAAKEESGDKDQGNDRKGDQGHLPMEVEKDDDDSDQEDDIPEKVDENGGEHFMDILNIIGEACDESSHRIPVEE